MTLLGLRRALRPLDAGVDVLGVLAEDHDVHQLGTLDRRRHALEVAHRAHAGVEVEHLAQRHVQAADAAADRRGQRPLDGDLVVLDRLERVVRQPLAVLRPWPSRRPAPRTRRSSSCRRTPCATAASNTRTLAFQMSGPVPSPSMKGTIGSSGTTSSPPRRVIAAPSVGGVRCTNCCIDVSRSDQPSLDLAGSHTRRRLVQGNLVL